jgi:hypothetical protein
MAKITPNQDFLHGKIRFEKGKEATVTDSEARYFAMNGWLEGTDVEGLPEEVTLSVDSGAHRNEGGEVGG